MSALDMREMIEAAAAADQPVILWGSPGTGKTAIIGAIAKRRGAILETLIGSTLDPTDVGGHLVPTASGEVRVSPPPWARRIRQALDQGRPAWLFLDELSCAPSAVQAAMLRIVHERYVGELDIRGCYVIAAANPSESAADGGWLSRPMAGRMTHIDFKVDSAAWAAGELAGWGKARSYGHARAAALVSAYISAHPQALLDEAPKGDRGAASPRTWSALAALMGSLLDSGRADTPQTAAIRVGHLGGGTVGDGSFSAFAAYAGTLELPDPEDVLAGRAALPTRGDRIAATLAAVVAAATREHQDQDARIQAAWSVLGKSRKDVSLTAASALIEQTGYIPDEACELASALRDAKRAIGVTS